MKVEPGADPAAVAARSGMAVVRYLPEIHWAEMVPLATDPGPRAQTRTLGDGSTVVTNAGPERLRRLGDEVAGDPVVRSVETVPDDTGLEWQVIPSDPIFQPTLKLPVEGEPQAGWHLTLPNFPIAWDSTTAAGTLVAVIDGEFDTTNLDLRDKLVNRYNVVSGTVGYHSANIGAEEGDEAHGTHVAGLVGASTNNGRAVAGACFECGIVAIKVSFAPTRSGAQTVADVAEGIVYAANSGARVLNMSLGGPQSFQPQLDAVNYAVSKGLVVVASGGNSQEESPGQINYPSAYPNVLGVGATDSHDQIAGFSTQGPWIDVSAPGKDVLSTTSNIDGEALSFEDGTLVAIKSGTSMASPIVAGLAALMIAVRPDLTPAEVEALIKATSHDLGIAGPDIIYGAGRIDAAAAVAAAKAYVRPVPPPPPAPPAVPVPPPVVKTKKKVRKLGAVLTLKVKRHKGKAIYYGKIRSAKKCRPERAVLLLGKHLKKPLARTGTNERGVFHLTLAKPPHRQVRVKAIARKVTPRLVCKSGTSTYLHGGR